MKITDPDVIKNGEKELIEAISEDLDLDAVKEILQQQIAETTLAAKGGKIIVHNNEIAFQMDFKLNLSGSLLFDRDGNYISPSDDSEPVLNDPEELDADLAITDLSLEDELDEGDELEDLSDGMDDVLADEPEDLLAEDLSDDELELGLPDEDLGELLEQDDSEDLGEDILNDLDLESSESETEPESDPDEMDDILQESREFWEQNQDS